MPLMDPICLYYGEMEETMEHIFLQCLEAKSVWFASQKLCSLLCSIWRRRNEWIFEKKWIPLEIVLDRSFWVICPKKFHTRAHHGDTLSAGNHQWRMTGEN
ncbi:hypothetical protein GLYMA_18G140550v4 [Glycine max]|nr:hypothetical protein GLYMA_18G140550v4 [Glycine max]KAH1154467.1 hypothetical protein GYH30_049948 [Glycine max]